jgi:hypothetical protein
MSETAQKEIQLVDALNIYGALDSISKSGIKYDVWTSIKINKIKKAFEHFQKGFEEHPDNKQSDEFKKFAEKQNEILKKECKLNSDGSIMYSERNLPIFKDIKLASELLGALKEEYKEVIDAETKKKEGIDTELKKKVPMPSFEPLDPADLKGDLSADDKILIETLIPILKV